MLFIPHGNLVRRKDRDRKEYKESSLEEQNFEKQI